MKRLLAVLLLCGLPSVALAGFLVQWDKYVQPGGGAPPATHMIVGRCEQKAPPAECTDFSDLPGGMVDINLTTFVDPNASPGKNWCYAIYALHADSRSGPSNVACVYVPKDPVIPQAQMRVVSVDSEETGEADNKRANAIDNNPATFWHTQWGGRVAPPPPHDIVVDLGRVYQVSAFAYLPRQDGQDNGTIARYEFAVSVDGPPWPAPVSKGTFSASTQLKTVEFPAQSGRFVRLTALSEINGHAWTSVAELQVFGTAAAD